MTIHLLSSRNYGPRSRKSLVQGISLVNVGEAQETLSHCTFWADLARSTNLDLMQLKSQVSSSPCLPKRLGERRSSALSLFRVHLSPFPQKRLILRLSSPSSSNTLEHGRKIHEEKKNTGVFPVYNLTRAPLTAALYYLNAWNRLPLRLRVVPHFSSLSDSRASETRARARVSLPILSLREEKWGTTRSLSPTCVVDCSQCRFAWISSDYFESLLLPQ